MNKNAERISINRGDRLKCCVSDCKRSIPLPNNFSEWICGQHYKFVPPKLKSLKRRTIGHAKKYPTKKNLLRMSRVWEKTKIAAQMRGL